MTYLRPILLDTMLTQLSALGDATCTPKSVNEADLNDYASAKQVRQRLDFPNNKSRTFFWKLEQGHWRVASYE